MASLYDLKERYLRLWELAEQSEGGELDPDIEFELRDNQDAIRDKADGYCRVIRNALGAAEMCKGEIQRLQRRKQAYENLVARLREHLAQCMDDMEIPKIQTDVFSVSVIWSESVVVECEPESLPEQYRRVSVSPDKSALKELLEQGEEIEGVRIERKTSVRIR